MKLYPFQRPTVVKIAGRSSSLTNAFVNGIIPVVEPSKEELVEAVKILDLDPDDLRCAYCGDPATEWDHLNPLIKVQEPSGYITEISNLVPACGKCNQSKGNKHWKTWMLGSAKLSPSYRGKLGLEDKMKRLEAYEERFKPQKLDLQNLAGKELWEKHRSNHKQLLKSLEEMQAISDDVRHAIQQAYSPTNLPR